MKVKSDYLTPIFKPEKYSNLIEKSITAIKKYKYKFDAIAFTGVSGAAFAFPIASTLKIPLICIRKKTDDSHYMEDRTSVYEGVTRIKRYIIVDDFCNYGGTIARIKREVKKKNPGVRCVGAYMCFDDKWEDHTKCQENY